MELELRNSELELKFPTKKLNPKLIYVNTYVVLPIYWNHNDPELWFLIYIYIYIYIYIRYAHRLWHPK